MKRVTMGLTPTDIENTSRIEKSFSTRSKASAVGTALSVAATITQELQNGNQILVRTPNGEIKQMVFAGFNPTAKSK